jgi:hypothetical protein
VSIDEELGAHPEVGSGRTYVEKALEEELLGHAPPGTLAKSIDEELGAHHEVGSWRTNIEKSS